MFFDPVRADPAAIAHHGRVLSQVCKEADHLAAEIRREVERIRLHLGAVVAQRVVEVSTAFAAGDPTGIALAEAQLALAQLALREFEVALGPLLKAAAHVEETTEHVGLGIDLIRNELSPALDAYQENDDLGAAAGSGAGGGVGAFVRTLSASFRVVPLAAVDLPGVHGGRPRAADEPTLTLLRQFADQVLPLITGRAAGSVLHLPATAIPAFDKCYGKYPVQLRERPAGRFAVVEWDQRISDARQAGLENFPADVAR
ncbi:hypothetical protein CcI49_14800 [Frankia sp. CcI49]|uniref:hypothetical protein n=1 Tax=Frankia sp. CcI49 TaxID=1745382 RepID=UPI000975888D|nr:hypothetical protein [Frankia sp. CcI49]ONH59973.1 hypothetical protein CcI49_14800 [Frankia sp. CcI49]